MIKKFMAIAAVAAMLIACGPDEPKDDPTPGTGPGTEQPEEPEEPEEPEFVGAIQIDGNFEDWDALAESQYAVATLPTEGTIVDPVLKTLKLHADELYIYIYLEYDPRGEYLESTNAETGEVTGSYSGVRYLDLFLDEDNDPATGRYYAWSNCSSYMLQGGFHGVTTPYDPGCDMYTGVDGQADWLWEDLGMYGVVTSVLPVEVSEDKALFECSLLRPAMTIPMAETIGVGAIVETEDWSSIGQLPQYSAEVVGGETGSEDNRPAMLFIDLPAMLE